MVNFEQTLSDERNPAQRLHYVDYAGLKRVLEEAVAGVRLSELLSQPQNISLASRPVAEPKSSVSAHFLTQLEGEISKVNSFANSSLTSLRSALQTLKEQASAQQPAAASTKVLHEEALRLEGDLVDLNHFVHVNITGFRKITKKFDKVLAERAGVWLGPRLAREAFCQMDLESELLGLSEVHAALRAADAASTAGGAFGGLGGKLQQPRKTEFKRETTKYWVRAQDQVQVTASILRHLPVFDPTAAAADESTPTRMGQWVSSVYLDSPGFESYRTRLNLEEGAMLVRLRFYGLNPESAPVVYVERKTHHEKWAGQRSVKARMPLSPEDVRAYLGGKALDLEAACAARAAKGELSSADASKAAALGSEVQAMVTSKQMAPLVRTVYRRMAFQSDAAASVRLTLDSSLQLLKELPPSAAAAAAGAWCTPAAEHVDASAVLRRFPHSILEVKLATEDGPPPWLADLLASGLVEEVPKFSKYITGAAVHHRTKLTAIPDWFAQPSLQEFVHPPAALPPLPAGGGGGVWAAPRAGDAAPPPQHPPQVVAASATAVAPYDGPTGNMPTSKRGADLRSRLRAGGMGGAAPTGPRTVRLVDRTAGRADPKVYFANERTFIQWLSAGMMMTSIGIAMIEFKAAQLRPPPYAITEAVDPVTGASIVPTTGYNGQLTDYLGGILICTLALSVILYGLFTYMHRLRKLKRRDMTGYDDRIGPFVLVFAVVLAVVVYITVHLQESHESTKLPTTALDGND